MVAHLLISNLYSLGIEATFSYNQNKCRSLLSFLTSFRIRRYSKNSTPVPLGSEEKEEWLDWIRLDTIQSWKYYIRTVEAEAGRIGQAEIVARRSTDQKIDGSYLFDRVTRDVLHVAQLEDTVAEVRGGNHQRVLVYLARVIRVHDEAQFQKYEQTWKHLSSRRGRYMKEEINKYERRREEKTQEETQFQRYKPENICLFVEEGISKKK